MEIVTQPRRPRRWVRALTTTLSVVVTLCALAFIVPAFFGFQRYAITGTSMTGTIDLGSLAYEEVVPVSELEVGDIITYQPPAGSGIDHLVTHRIISIHGRTFRTQGDAVPQPDPWKFRLDHDEQARVRFAVPYAGWPLIWLADRQTRIVFIGVPAGIITLISLAQVIQVLRRRDEDELPADDVTPGTPSLTATR